MRPVLRYSAPLGELAGDGSGSVGREVPAVGARSRFGQSCLAASLTLLVAACGSIGSDSGRIDPQYGVAASPQLADKNSTIPRGGGVYKVGRPYQIAGNWYYPREDVNYDSIGIASWYGDDFHGRQTANGEVFDMNALSAAHPTLPMPTYARVTNLENGRSIVVRVNDRGPFAKGREIDLSRQAAKTLGMKHQGTAKVRVQYVSRARLEGSDDGWLRTTYVDGGATGNEPLTQLAQAAQNQSGSVQIAQNQLSQGPVPQGQLAPQSQMALTNAPQVRNVQTQIIRPGVTQQQPMIQQAGFVQPQTAQPQFSQPALTQPMPQPLPAAGIQAQQGYGNVAPRPSPVATQVAPAYTATGNGSGLVAPAPISGFADSFVTGQSRIDAAFSAISRHRDNYRKERMLDPLTIDPAGTGNRR